MQSVHRTVQRYLLVWLSLSSLLAYYWPVWFPALGDPLLASRPYLWWMIAATMLVIGYMLPAEEVRQVFRRWPQVLGGTAIQYITMPVLAMTVSRLFAFSDETMIGVVIVGCVPGAMASNVLTLNARGNVSYSVSLTTMATLLSPLVVPFTLYLALGKQVDFPVGTVALQLLLAIVVPVIAGHLLARLFPQWEGPARSAGSVIANLVILWIIAVVVASNRDRLEHLGGSLLAALVTINLLGYLAGCGGGVLLRLPEPMRRAITLEIGMQNAGLGAALASEFFGSAAAIPAALYTFGCMFTGTLLAWLWAMRSDWAARQDKQ